MWRAESELVLRVRHRQGEGGSEGVLVWVWSSTCPESPPPEGSPPRPVFSLMGNSGNKANESREEKLSFTHTPLASS